MGRDQRPGLGEVGIKASGLQQPTQRPVILARMAVLRLLLLCLAGLVLVAEAGPLVSVSESLACISHVR